MESLFLTNYSEQTFLDKIKNSLRYTENNKSLKVHGFSFKNMLVSALSNFSQQEVPK